MKTEAIKLANKESGKKTEEVPVAKIFPPVISILSPQDGAEVSTKEIEVKFFIRNPSAEPSDKSEGFSGWKTHREGFGNQTNQKRSGPPNNKGDYSREGF